MNLDELLSSHDELKKEINIKADSWDNETLYSKQKELLRIKSDILEITFNKQESKKGISFNDLKQRVKNQKQAPKYATGITKLDEALGGGIEVGSLIILGAGSFIGKSTLIFKILTGVAFYNKTVFFNFEMGEKRSVRKLDKFIANKEQGDNLIIDSHSRELETLCGEIVIYSKKGVKFFAIDSRMKIICKSFDSDHLKNAEISKRLSQTAQENDVIIFLINQISEENLKSGRLAFKGSGDQQYDSDISLFLIATEGNENSRTLVCNKNRQTEKQFSFELFRHEVEPLEVKETEFKTDDVEMPII